MAIAKKRKKKFKTLLSKDRIQNRVRKLGQEITKSYTRAGAENILVIGILKGSFIFVADLVRSIALPCEIDFIEVSSYGESTVSSGKIRLKRDIETSIKGRHVLIVEDIVDTGLTMSHLLKSLKGRSPKSLAVCSLLDKPSRRKTQVKVDYLGFTIEDHFVVGYGLDFNSQFRQFDSVVIFDPSV